MSKRPSDDRTLSNNIHLLGDTLGTIIQEQHHIDDFQLVEEIRALAKDRRSGNGSVTEQLANRINELNLEQKNILIKAFSNYFQLINIAEDLERLRVLRQREHEGDIRESIEAALQILKENGISAEEMAELFNHTRLRLVLTAHPSEAKRKEILIKLRHIAQMMSTRQRMNLLPREAEALQAELAEEIEELWQTRPIRASRKQVADEVDFGLYFITSVIMDVVIDVYGEMQASLETHYPELDWTNPPAVIRYASWIGGDRDGNPNVTTDVTLQTIETQHSIARQVYLQELDFLQQHLTQDTDEFGVSDSLADAVYQHPSAVTKFPQELYRQQIEAIRQQLLNDSYRSSRDFLDDLLHIQDSLMEHHGKRVAHGEVLRLIRKVRLFGLHLLPLEVREDAGLHAHALDELLRYYGRCENYLELSEGDKQTLLNEEIAKPRPLFPTHTPRLSDITHQIMATWRMIAEAHERYDPIVIDTVIASMSKQPSDVLTMLLFAHTVGIQEDVAIVPLFETIVDLENAPDTMTTLFNNPEYKKYLEARAKNMGLRQQVMIGYSDSSKDGGYIASNWNLYNAQKKLTETCLEQGVSLELFHGRGGSIGRGGGPTNRAILSQPPKSLRGGIKVTEQGEVIAYRYSNADIARRHLHQVMNAVLLAMGREKEHQIRAEWREAMEMLSETGRQAYRAFVYEDENFLEYWQQATPIHELSQLQISSRPAKRKSKGGFAAMRAIPWVFSWMQSRAIIPSWYGVGKAVQSYLDSNSDGLNILQTMFREWSFFKALIENTELDVAKADMGIAELYASLVDNSSVRDDYFRRIQREHQLTKGMICKIKAQDHLLDNMPAIQTSIERRNPYVDPLNFIQVDLMRQLRGMKEDDPNYGRVLNAVLGTINGIAAGMKTTG